MGSQVLLDNTERFAELLAMSQNSTDSGKPIRISRPNIGRQSVEHIMYTKIECIGTTYTYLSA